MVSDADGNMIGMSASGGTGPMLVYAWSVKEHTDVGDFAIPLPLTQPAAASVECRVGGPTRIVLEFTEPVTLDACNNVSLSSGSCSGVTDLGSNRYEVAISGATANACLTLTLVDVESTTTGKHLVGVKTVKVVVLKGDVDADSDVDDDDYSIVQGHVSVGDPVDADTFRSDVTADGNINIFDLIATNGNKPASASCTLAEQPMHWQYTWDAENRLIGVEPADPAVDDVKLTFVYDYRSRRVARQAWHWDGTEWDTVVNDDLQMFVYDEWNVALVLKGSTEAVTHQYTWGLDLSGLSGSGVGPASSRSTDGIHNAGGIGGLLATVDLPAESSYWHFYDGNGNVGQLLEYDASGDTVSTTPAAHYEYDPYGQLIRTTGTYAEANPIRFSTKWRDRESGHYYYGQRYYDGIRWLSRDPIQEEGGVNLYGFVRNGPADRTDPLGLKGYHDPANDCKYACGQCYNACSAATGCDDGDCPPSSRRACEKVRSNCHLMCQIAKRPTKRCGGASFLTCRSVPNSALLTGGVAGGAVSTVLFVKGCPKLGCCAAAISLPATLIAIANIWSDASLLTQQLNHYQDYTECSNNCSGMVACEEFLE